MQFNAQHAYGGAVDQVRLLIAVSLDGSNDPTILKGKTLIASAKHTATGRFTFITTNNFARKILGYGGAFVSAQIHSGVSGSAQAVVDIMAQEFGASNLSGTLSTPAAGTFEIDLITPGTTTLVDPPAAATNACNLLITIDLVTSTIPY